MAVKEESDYFPLPCGHDRGHTLAGAWAVLLRDPCTGAHRHLLVLSYQQPGTTAAHR